MVRYNKTINQKLHKEFCEIEGCDVTEPAMLHWHHVIGRKEEGTSNDPFNLAVLCANHHNMFHRTDRLKFIGVFPSTTKYGRKLIYILDGVCNCPELLEEIERLNEAKVKFTK